MRRTFTPWDPWRELNQIQTEMNRLFSGLARPGQRREAFPAINMYHNAESVVLTAELPGLDTEKLDLTVTGRAIAIHGAYGKAPLPDGETYLRQERPVAEFSRTVELPVAVDPQRAEASYEKGVLVLKLHRPEEHKPRKVTIRKG